MIHKLQSAWVVLTSLVKTRKCTRRGKLIRVWGQVQIHGDVRLGDRVRVRATHVPVELAAGPGAVIEIGESSFINAGVSIGAQERVSIGRNCAIGNYTLIMDSDFHNPKDHTLPGVSAPVVLEDDVWLGARVTVLKGVRIGQGAVVAAGAVVTRDVAPHTLVGGVPARLIRSLQATPRHPEAHEA